MAWANLLEKTSGQYVVIPTEIRVKELRLLAELSEIVVEIRNNPPKRRKRKPVFKEPESFSSEQFSKK
jgi:hypothetical protein